MLEHLLNHEVAQGRMERIELTKDPDLRFMFRSNLHPTPPAQRIELQID